MEVFCIKDWREERWVFPLTIFSNEHWYIVVPLLNVSHNLLYALWVNIQPLKLSLHA